MTPGIEGRRNEKEGVLISKVSCWSTGKRFRISLQCIERRVGPFRGASRGDVGGRGILFMIAVVLQGSEGKEKDPRYWNCKGERYLPSRAHHYLSNICPLG